MQVFPSGKSFEHNLHTLARHDADLSEGVRLYTIPRQWRAEVLHDLRLMNVTRATLFSGLDGFAQSLRYSLIQEDPTQRAMRMSPESAARGAVMECAGYAAAIVTR